MPTPRRPLRPALLLTLLAACTGGGATTDASGAAGSDPGSGPGGTSDANGTTSAGSDATTSAPTTSATTNTSNTTNNPTTGATTTATDPTATSGDPTGASATSGDPPPLGESCQGYATRYWDCCKAHCGWQGNVNPATDALASCDKDDQSHGADYNVTSACQTPAQDSAFTCYDMSPWAVHDKLAYGFAAVPASGDICGRCYQLQFDGTGHYNAQDPGSVALLGKTMIVQATNIGFDVGGGQFDILTPGGGVGLFDACSYQWDVNPSELGATYGGFMTYCQQQVGGDHQQLKDCVTSRCDAVFGKPALAELAAGCAWYVQWYQVADNPNLHYQEVKCPAELVARSGIDRGPLDDVGQCAGGRACSQEQMDMCDCSWTNNGQNCGQDDGSCCWTACCG